MDAGDDERDRRHQWARWANEELVLYSVVGLRRVRGVSLGGMGSALVRSGRAAVRPVVMTQSVGCVDDDGGTITVTSHRRDMDERYALTRDWAPVNPYLATPEGRAAAAQWDRSGPGARPLDVRWRPATIVVDGQEAAFEVCDIGAGWVAVGEVPDVVISIHSRGVPLDSVELARLTDRGYPPPRPPDLGERTDPVIGELDGRFERIPFQRVRGYADYWALQGIEGEHTKKLAVRYGLTAPQTEALHRYWYERIDAHLAERMDRWAEARMTARHTSRISRRLGSGFLFQLWNNTLGPGGRTWFGNRYSTIRPYTFRIRWRP